MKTPSFFGYGSLVNTATHSYPDPRPVTLQGWRRMWRHTTLQETPFLTVVPDPASRIDGLLAHVPGDDWAALDERERGYFRSIVQDHAITPPQPDLAVQVYQTKTEHDMPAGHSHPILMSYLDVVVQGFSRVFGEEGVARFFATTSGWDAPVLDDRSAPRYPRAQILSAQEVALVDHHLAALSVDVLPLERPGGE